MPLISDLAKKLALKPKELKKKILELGFELPSRARSIDDDLAHVLEKALVEEHDTKSHDLESSSANNKIEQYEAFYEHQLEKEIIKKQRKQTAGKEKSLEKGNLVEAALLQSQKGTIEIPAIISVKEFSEKCGISATKIIGELMKNGILANINQRIDFETAMIIADDLGIKLKKEHAAVSIEDLKERNLKNLLKEDDPTVLIERPPVVSVMGHVDHGKTLLLDAIRETNIIATEAGGITQHIGAYQVEKGGKKITFIDTPGHEAFTAMRARGAKATDIAILVVAADEGVKPQTIEAYNHAKEAAIPVIIALNKIDKEGINLDKVKAQLSELGLQPEEWGGNTIMIPISALRKEGLDDLLASILLVAETLQLKANPNRPAVATVLESHLDLSLGPIATVIVNTGTLHFMDNIVIGSCYGRIKVMYDHTGMRISYALPSMPVRIAGLSTLPQMGDVLQVVQGEKKARLHASQIKDLQQDDLMLHRVLKIEEIASQIKSGSMKYLKLVIKADTKGSLEAISQALSKIPSKYSTVKIIHSGIGNVSESDVLMAQASHGLIIGFNVIVPLYVSKIAHHEYIKISLYSVIYKLIEDIETLLSGLIEPEEVTTELGKLKVKKIFYTKKNEMVVGCAVIQGTIEKKAQLRVLRDNMAIGKGKVEGLKIVNQDVSQVLEGNDCGIKFAGSCQLAEGDILEVFKVEMQKRTPEK